MILGERHMECAYYFGRIGARHLFAHTTGKFSAASSVQSSCHEIFLSIHVPSDLRARHLAAFVLANLIQRAVD